MNKNTHAEEIEICIGTLSTIAHNGNRIDPEHRKQLLENVVAKLEQIHTILFQLDNLINKNASKEN